MELRQLSYFATIVNEGNISQAAKKLNISQPPLSHQMKLLEAELGVTLFERGSRRIRLTPAGKTFYDRALVILDLSQAARTELTAQKQEIQGNQFPEMRSKNKEESLISFFRNRLCRLFSGSKPSCSQIFQESISFVRH